MIILIPYYGSNNHFKNKINKSLEELNPVNLQSVYLILKELINQHNYPDFKADRKIIDAKITKGIRELNSVEGTDFLLFLNEMQEKYGGKK